MSANAGAKAALEAGSGSGHGAGDANAVKGLRELRPLPRLDLASEDAQTSVTRRELCRRGAVPDARVRELTRGILDGLRSNTDDGVRRANVEFGGGLADGRLLLDRGALERAADELTNETREALEAAIANVRRFAETQRPSSTTTEIVPGVSIERRWLPVGRAGCYVPGGSAAYPSSLIMNVVPAHVAGVETIVVASPARSDGSVDPVLLGAAGLLDVDAFVVAGGAQAIGALAFGLPEAGLEPVDLIVGPGSSWVTAAKVELAGEVGIDLPAGPSEGLVLVDATADPELAAADLLTQAEHGPDSPAILVTTDPSVADAVEAEVRRQLATAARRGILATALERHGRIVLAPDLAAAVGFVNDYAPEHLSIDVEPLEATVAQIRNAGSVFVGRWAPESAGDYASGANHVLPTGGLARACGALAVDAFGKFIQVQRLTRDGLATLRPTIATLAAAEGLLAHRAAADLRFEEDRRIPADGGT
ncbi:MAG: histidinol dehydrogenase [Chloroflexi bacterium]|nr:histidinol dehydrogenase [Chloroflexota bacterium]